MSCIALPKFAQFLFRDDKLSGAAVEAYEKLWKYENRRQTNAFQSGKVDGHFAHKGSHVEGAARGTKCAFRQRAHFDFDSIEAKKLLEVDFPSQNVEPYVLADSACERSEHW